MSFSGEAGKIIWLFKGSMEVWRREEEELKGRLHKSEVAGDGEREEERRC